MTQVINGDTVVALIGTMMALFLISRHSALQRLSAQRRFVYAAAWAAAIGVVAAVMARLYP